jgi:phosphonate transport system permease protein
LNGATTELARRSRVQDNIMARIPSLVQSPDRRSSASDVVREELLRPLPRLSLKTLLLVVVGLGIYAWGINGTDARPSELVKGIPNIIDFVVRLFPAELELQSMTLTWPQTVGLVGAPVEFQIPTIVTAIVETIQMAIIGTTISIFLALPFGLLAARNTSPHPVVYQGTRLLLNANRAVPELIFALIFVSAVGLGPFGGVLALAVSSIGFMSKMYSEAVESIDPQQLLAVRATGANRLQTFVYGVIPQALPLVASYSLYLFEHNIRAASILGIVGAGGVGFVISKYMALFQFRRLMGALILIIVVVTAIDRLSDYLRKRII